MSEIPSRFFRTISSPEIKSSKPEVNFSWGPTATPWAELSGYPWAINQPRTGAPAQDPIYKTNATAEITFTAEVRVPYQDFIINYEWDFGDGFTAYGPEVTHTYQAASPFTRAVLSVTDNHGRRFSRGKQMNLRPGDPTLISLAIIG